MEKETTEEAGMAVFNNKQKLGHWLGVFATIEWLSIPNAPIWGGDSVSLTSGKGCRFGRGRWTVWGLTYWRKETPKWP